MQGLVRILVPAMLAAVSCVCLAQSSPPPPPKYVYHYEWTRGAQLTNSEWARSRVVDPHRHHLAPAPRGCEWREIDRNYVLASRSTHAVQRVVAARH